MSIDVKLQPCNIFLDESRNLKGGAGHFIGCENRDDCLELKALKKVINENVSVFEKFKTDQVSVEKIELGVKCQNYKR